MVDDHRAPLHAHVPPPQGKKLSAPDARCQGNQRRGPKPAPLERVQHLAAIVFIEGPDLFLLRAGRLRRARWIAREELPPDSLLQRLVQHPVVMQHRLSRQAPIPLPAAVLERFRVMGLNMKRMQLGERVMPERGY